MHCPMQSNITVHPITTTDAVQIASGIPRSKLKMQLYKTQHPSGAARQTKKTAKTYHVV